MLPLGAARAPAQPMLDLNQMALQWTLGAWASPLICEGGEHSQRGLRKVTVASASRDLIPPSNRLTFYPMGIPAEVHCYLDTGEGQPEVSGSIVYHLESVSRPDLAGHDFQQTLQRLGGFDFTIRSGSLQIDGKKVDFAQGKARFEPVRPGTDSFRRLQDIQSPHKLALTLEAKDGTRLTLDLVQTGPPPSH